MTTAHALHGMIMASTDSSHPDKRGHMEARHRRRLYEWRLRRQRWLQHAVCACQHQVPRRTLGLRLTVPYLEVSGPDHTDGCPGDIFERLKKEGFGALTDTGYDDAIREGAALPSWFGTHTLVESPRLPPDQDSDDD